MNKGKVPMFELWLEFEHSKPLGGDDHLSDNLENIKVILPDGRTYALNVWTFKFLNRARFPWPYEENSGPPAEYVIPPDLFVEQLDRPTLERVVRQMLINGEMKTEWLCPADEVSP